MNETLAEQGTPDDADRTTPTAWNVLKVAAALALGGTVVGTFEYFLRGRDIREVSLPTFLFAYPALTAWLGWMWRRNPAPEGWGWRRPEGFFATGPMPEEERERRARRLRRSTWFGFGYGILVGLATSAIDFAWRGWPYISTSLGFNLFFFPYIGVLFGRNMAVRRGDPKPSLRDLRFGMLTLMILTAYLAFYLAATTRTMRLSGLARSAKNQSQGARSLADVYRKVLDQNLRDVGRAKNAEELRAGRIPRGLLPSQISFLKSLDGTATEEYKKYRYGLIADGEQRQADVAAGNVDLYRRLVDHQETLADKYARASREPWLPIAPDPPMPR